jgi:hypothetical protein
LKKEGCSCEVNRRQREEEVEKITVEVNSILDDLEKKFSKKLREESE